MFERERLSLKRYFDDISSDIQELRVILDELYMDEEFEDDNTWAYFKVVNSLDKLNVIRKDFEGLVQGRGHGMQDNVIMDIKQNGGLLAVSPKEYVVPADVMANLGNGNPDAGAEHMDKFISDFRKKKYGRDKQPPEMDGATALQSLMA